MDFSQTTTRLLLNRSILGLLNFHSNRALFVNPETLIVHFAYITRLMELFLGCVFNERLLHTLLMLNNHK